MGNSGREKEKIEEWANSLELGYTHMNWNDIRAVIKEMFDNVEKQ